MDKLKIFFSLWVWVSMVSAEPTKEIAITIDDLPFVGSANGNPNNLKREKDRFEQIIQTLLDHHIPAIGFVIGGSIEKGQWQLLEEWKEKGFLLGNHTYSHLNLNVTPADKYIENISHCEEKIKPLLSEPKYFRYPYLAESRGEKQQKIYNYLKEHQYIIAPVTVDSKDYVFNEQLYHVPYRSRPAYLPQLKKRYLNYIWNQTLKAEKKAANSGNANVKQILLIHANLLNSHFLGDIIELFEKNGYKIISLDEALKNPAQPLQFPGPEKQSSSENKLLQILGMDHLTKIKGFAPNL